MPLQSTLSNSYTFLNLDTMVTAKASDIARELMDKAAKRDPDAFDMYIYNDFFAYGVLDLVDNTLSTLHSKVTKKDWSDAYSILEAITVFVDCESSWTQCDDGDRVKVTNSVYGAMAVAILRGLKKEGRLDPISLPSLESCLMGIASVGDMMDSMGCECSYAHVARGIARRLFKDKSDEQKALEKKRQEEWVDGITDEEKKQDMKDELIRLSEEKGEPWYMQGIAVDEDSQNREFAITRTWKEYKTRLSSVPRGPMRGPSWDISSWSAKEKEQFQFSSMDNDSD